QTYADPFAFPRGNDWSVMGAIDSERLLGHSRVGFVGYLDDGGADRPFFIPVLVIEAVSLFNHCFEIPIYCVNGAGRVHPTTSLVEALVNEELPPGGGAVGVQTLVARHMQLGPEEERRVWVDQQQRVTRNRVRRRDSHAIRSTWLGLVEQLTLIIRRDRDLAISVESLQRLQAYPFDVSADAAFAKREHHP